MAIFCKTYGLNAIYAGKHWTERNRDKEYWHWLVKSELIKQKISIHIFDKPVCITFFWDDGLDCSNHAYMAKMIEDCLRGYFITDDSRRYVAEIRNKFHDEQCIKVEIEEFLGGRND
jgi:hypothetical protein